MPGLVLLKNKQANKKIYDRVVEMLAEKSGAENCLLK